MWWLLFFFPSRHLCWLSTQSSHIWSSSSILAWPWLICCSWNGSYSLIQLFKLLIIGPVGVITEPLAFFRDLVQYSGGSPFRNVTAWSQFVSSSLIVQLLSFATFASYSSSFYINWACLCVHCATTPKGQMAKMENTCPKIFSIRRLKWGW